jgi:hypothetical protein
MPTTLDILFRFFEYNRDDESQSWAISGGTLEGTKRYYRVMYEEEGCDKFQCELVFDIYDSNIKEKILVYVNTVLERVNLGVSSTFSKTLQQLFIQDPWMQENYASPQLIGLCEP